MLWKHYEMVATGFPHFPEKNQQTEKPGILSKDSHIAPHSQGKNWPRNTTS